SRLALILRQLSRFGDQLLEIRIQLLRLVFLGLLSLFVSVESGAALLTEMPGFDEKIEQPRRLEARTIFAVEEILDMRADDDASHVEQSERSHRHTEVDNRLVNLLGCGDALLKNPERLVHVREEQAIDEESRAFLDAHRNLAHFAAQLDGCVHG